MGKQKTGAFRTFMLPPSSSPVSTQRSDAQEDADEQGSSAASFWADQ